jgi:hypothetical protein
MRAHCCGDFETPTVQIEPYARAELLGPGHAQRGKQPNELRATRSTLTSLRYLAAACRQSAWLTRSGLPQRMGSRQRWTIEPYLCLPPAAPRRPRMRRFRRNSCRRPDRDGAAAPGPQPDPDMDLGGLAATNRPGTIADEQKQRSAPRRLLARERLRGRETLRRGVRAGQATWTASPAMRRGRRQHSGCHSSGTPQPSKYSVLCSKELHDL